MIIVPPIFKWEWDQGIIREFGTAVFIAAFLGLTIDRWLKTKFAQDVFEAALGYIAPDEFREEIRRTISYKFLCERHIATMMIEDLGNQQVRFTLTSERTLRNITNGTERLKASAVIDEWGFDELSQIHECRLEFGGRPYSTSSNRTTAETISAESEEVDIPPGHTATLLVKTTEIRRSNDDWSVAYLSPTRNPEIEVIAPSHECKVEFGRAEYLVKKETYGHRHRMQGTYFPTQHMRLRWWPKTMGKPDKAEPGA